MGRTIQGTYKPHDATEQSVPFFFDYKEQSALCYVLSHIYSSFIHLTNNQQLY